MSPSHTVIPKTVTALSLCVACSGGEEFTTKLGEVPKGRMLDDAG
jgi:hypothetical protein